METGVKLCAHCGVKERIIVYKRHAAWEDKIGHFQDESSMQEAGCPNPNKDLSRTVQVQDQPHSGTSLYLQSSPKNKKHYSYGAQGFQG